MAGSYQRTRLIGNVGQDGDLRYTPQGAPVTSFSVAVNPRRRKQDATGEDKAIWWKIKGWNMLADKALHVAKKGNSVYCEGEAKVEEWSGNDGTRRFSLVLELTEAPILLSGEWVELEGDDAGPAPVTRGPIRQPRVADVDDIPF